MWESTGSRLGLLDIFHRLSTIISDFFFLFALLWQDIMLLLLVFKTEMAKKCFSN